MIGKSLLAIALFAVTPTWAAEAIQPLDIKPGLWEITLTVRTSGPPPLPRELLLKLTPEERARIEAKAKERAAAGARTTVKRNCLDDNARHSMLTFGSEGQGCQQTVVNTSRTRQEIRVECGQGLSKGGGTFRIEAMDPENVKVSSDWSATDGSRTIKTSSTATLRWLGAICELEFPDAPGAGAPKAAERKAVVPGVVASKTAVPTPATAAAPVPAPPVAPPPVAAPPVAPPKANTLKVAARKVTVAKATPASGDADYYYKLGREQAGRDDFQEALRSFDRAIEMDAQHALPFNARGYVYLRLKNFASAMADFSEAIRLRPDYANAYQNRAIARRRLGDEKGAAEDSRKAAELGNRH